MRTVLSDPLPPEVEQFMERRREQGLDIYDEIWEGVCHVAPMARFRHGRVQAAVLAVLSARCANTGLVVSGPFNLGDAGDFRIPDAGLLGAGSDPDSTYLSSAVMVVEILSPEDRTWDKFDFYAARRVRELVVVDPDLHQVRIWTLGKRGRTETDRSTVLDVGAASLQEAISWP